MPSTAQFIDLSRLQRRKPDLTNIMKPRFLFDGWEIRDAADKKVTEEEFDAGKRGVRVVLPRGTRFSLVIKYSAVEDSRWVAGSGYGVGWNITGPVLCEYWPLTISKNVNLKFAELVHEAEAFIMRAVDKHNYEVIRSPDPEMRNFKTYVAHVEYCIAQWRKVEHNA